MKASRYAFGLVLATGVALGCAKVFSIGGLVINVGFLDVIIAGVQGYSNPPRAV